MMNHLITNISATYQEIRLTCTNYDIVLTACSMCCSKSWFEFQSTIENCIGKTYVSCSDTYREIELPLSGLDEVDKNHVYELLFDDDTRFEIILRNSSNGYYDGYVEEKMECISMYPLDVKKNSLIILIGLPGCGKTTYGTSICDSIQNSVFYDDADLMLQSTIIKIRTDLYFGKKVIVANSQLCIPYRYQQFIDTMNLMENDKSIVTYCFIPNKTKSIQNIKNRHTSSYIITQLITSINHIEPYYTMEFILSTHQCKKIQTY
jgi:adenylate kinase family enzyme